MITAAVLAFVQAAMVLIASLYVWFAASIVDVVTADAPGSLDAETAQGLATEGTVLAIVQVLSAALLVGAGVIGAQPAQPAHLGPAARGARAPGGAQPCTGWSA